MTLLTYQPRRVKDKHDLIYDLIIFSNIHRWLCWHCLVFPPVSAVHRTHQPRN